MRNNGRKQRGAISWKHSRSVVLLSLFHRSWSRFQPHLLSIPDTWSRVAGSKYYFYFQLIYFNKLKNVKNYFKVAGKVARPELSGRMIFVPESNKHFGVSGFNVSTPFYIHQSFSHSRLCWAWKNVFRITTSKRRPKLFSLGWLCSELHWWCTEHWFQTGLEQFLVLCCKHCPLLR